MTPGQSRGKWGWMLDVNPALMADEPAYQAFLAHTEQRTLDQARQEGWERIADIPRHMTLIDLVWVPGQDGDPLDEDGEPIGRMIPRGSPEAFTYGITDDTPTAMVTHRMLWAVRRADQTEGTPS